MPVHIRSVSYILSPNYEIISVADEFVEFKHISGEPFLPGEVWGKGLWAHIQQSGLSRTFHSLFMKARRRPLSMLFRLDSDQEFRLWQIQAQASGVNTLVGFQQLAQSKRPRLPEGQALVKPTGPIDSCGWCNRITEPGGQPRWATVEEAEYITVLGVISKSSVRHKICDECTKALIHSHEPKYFQHLSQGMNCGNLGLGAPTLHQITA